MASECIVRYVIFVSPDDSNVIKLRVSIIRWINVLNIFSKPGESGSLFTGVNYNLYQPPPGFCFDVLCDDQPIVDNPKSKEYNVESRVSFNAIPRKRL